MITLLVAAFSLFTPLSLAAEVPRGVEILASVAPVSTLPLHVTGPMEDWLRERVPAKLPPRRRLELLMHHLLAPEGLAMEEISGHTATAAEAFLSRRADCVAFAHLFIALARATDLPVFFVAVVQPESYERQGDLRVATFHLAAGYGSLEALTLYDFGGKSRPQGQIRVVSDRTAAAIFASNRAAEALRAHDLAASLLWSDRSVRLDPDWAPAWINRGVALRRSGDHAAAMAAYRRALALDGRQAAARVNLQALRRRHHP